MLEYGTDEQKAEWVDDLAARPARLRLRHHRAGARLGRHAHGDPRRARRRRVGDQRREDVEHRDPQGAVRPDLRPHQRQARRRRRASPRSSRRPTAPGFEIDEFLWTFNMPTDHAHVSLTDVRVPHSAIFGGEGRGLGVVQHFFNENRIRQAASSLGAAQFCINESVAYAKERKPFGKPLATNQAIQFPLVELQTQCEMLRALIHKTAWEMDTDGAFSQSDKVSMCNYWANRLCCEAADRAMQVHGGLGYSRHKPFEHIYRHHRRYRITEGAEEIQMRRVAGYMFGFMKQQAPKGVAVRVADGRAVRHPTRPTSWRRSAGCSTSRSSPPSRRTCSTRCASPPTWPASSSASCASARPTPRASASCSPSCSATTSTTRRRRSPSASATATTRRSRPRAWTGARRDHPRRPRRRQARPRRVGGRVTCCDRRRAAWPPTSARRGASTVAVEQPVDGDGRRPPPQRAVRRHRRRRRRTTSSRRSSRSGETIINPIDAEAGVRALAEKAGVAVPHVHLVRTDGELVGGPFMISEFVAGETVPRRVLRLVEEQGIGERVADAARRVARPAARHRPGDGHRAAAHAGGRAPVRRRARRAAARRRRAAAAPPGARARAALARAAPAGAAGAALDRPHRRAQRQPHRRRGRPARRARLGGHAGVRRPDAGPGLAGAAHVALPQRHRRDRRVRRPRSRSSPATRRPAARSTRTASSGGRSRARCAGRSAWPARRWPSSTAASRAS